MIHLLWKECGIDAFIVLAAALAISAVYDYLKLRTRERRLRQLVARIKMK